MKRSKKQKKHEKPGPTRSSQNPEKQEVDLNYYVKDRVELLHQTFAILKPREIKNMVPKCLRHLPFNELKEVCLSELLGISSKRLYATLAGATPPSDTESSSETDEPADDFDSMSLESISSDDALLNQQSSGGASKKCKRQGSHKLKEKNRGKSKENKKGRAKSHSDSKTAQRAGLTVLEMLELHARAQAIKSQLRAEQQKNNLPTSTITSAEANISDNDDDVEIKEEPPEIVELTSSEDEKPDVEQLQQMITNQLIQEAQTSKIDESSQSITIRNNLTIIVPKTKVTQKIKLNRMKKSTFNQPEQKHDVTKLTEKSIQKAAEIENIHANNKIANATNTYHIEKNTANLTTITELNASETIQKTKLKKRKNKAKKKKVRVKKDTDAEGTDHDEISLQLSDTEKMDLLEDFDRKSNDDAKSTEESTDSDNHSRVIESENLLAINQEHNQTDESSLIIKASDEISDKTYDKYVPANENLGDSGNDFKDEERKCKQSEKVQTEIIGDDNSDFIDNKSTQITAHQTKDQPNLVDIVEIPINPEDESDKNCSKIEKLEENRIVDDADSAAQSKTSTEDKQSNKKHKKKKNKKSKKS